jgi:integrase
MVYPFAIPVAEIFAMGRRPAGALPQMRRHEPTNTARIKIGGKVYSLGRWGSDEAQRQFDTFIAAYVTSGRTSVDAALGVLGRTRTPARPAAGTPAAPKATRTAEPVAPATPPSTGLTVGDLALRWLQEIEATTPNHRRTSKWHGAIAASRAVRPFGAMPVAAFGSRALIEVQRHLVELEIEPRRRKGDDDDAPPPAPKRLSRRYINDVIGRVRQMFHWGVLQELVPDDRVKALEIVPALAQGQTKAREIPERKPVRPSIVRATLPYLTAEVADLIWFIRLTGCRPSEAGRMKLRRIRDRNKAVWRYVPRKHKTSHRGKQRHIAIGPEAQAIILAHTADRSNRDYVFTPQRSVPPRKPRAGVLSMKPRKPSPLVKAMFTKDSILRAVTRAIEKANKAREAKGEPALPRWTPYQLRYTRLREIRRRGGREAAQALAGHSRATMTDHYAPANWGRAAKFAAKHG